LLNFVLDGVGSIDIPECCCVNVIPIYLRREEAVSIVGVPQKEKPTRL